MLFLEGVYYMISNTPDSQIQRFKDLIGTNISLDIEKFMMTLRERLKTDLRGITND